MNAWTSGAAILTAACMAAFGPAVPTAAAQGSVAERLGLDKLHLSALGVAAGPVRAAHVEPAVSYAVQADYGEIAPHWRIFVTASYWGSSFTDEAVNGFVEKLHESIVDPAQDDTLEIGPVTVSDIALDVDARYTPLRHTFISPYVSIGLGAHVVNAESAFIQGTFVEGALDNIGTGLSGAVGLNLVPSSRLSLGVQARYTLLANVRFGTLRASGSYHFALAPPLSTK